jgi:RNA 2',3'-cyclic 3'-phosphodiesterase
MPSLRLFIATDLSADQRAACAQLIENLRKGVQFTKAYPKWVEPNAMHLTLKFLGDVDSARVPQIAQALDPVASTIKAFTMGFKGLGVFPSERQPRILWVGVQAGHREVLQLQFGVERALNALGFPPEDRPFHPHLTLARIKSTRGAEALMDVVHSHRDSDLGQATVDHMTLYQSTLLPEGPVYKALHTWSLT